MAVYEYLCRSCGATSQIRATFEEKDAGIRPVCEQCKGEDLRRSFSPVSVAAPSRALPTMGGGGGGGGGGGCCGGGGCGC